MTTALAPRPALNLGALSDPAELGRLLAASGYFKDAKDAAQAVVKVLAGAELGFGPIASMTGIYIVEGRVTLSANLMAATIKRHPRYDYRVAELTDEKAELWFFENGEQSGTSEFTMDDARRAGLASRQNWRQFPRNMLLWRALSNGAKFYCPDAFSGAPVYTPEELGADTDPETGELIHAPVQAASPTPSSAAPAAQVVEPVAAEVGEPETTENAVPSSPATPSEPAEPEPEQLAVEPVVTTADPEAPLTTEEAGKLRETLEALGVSDTFLKMGLMRFGATDLETLTHGQAHELHERALARFPG